MTEPLHNFLTMYMYIGLKVHGDIKNLEETMDGFLLLLSYSDWLSALPIALYLLGICGRNSIHNTQRAIGLGG